MSKFSIVVPTYNRPDTLKYCLQTLQWAGDDCEIVVADNSSDALSTAVAYEAGLKNLVYVKNDPIGMRRNWEAGLNAATGEYITFLGDDDGLMPNGMHYVRLCLQHKEPDLIMWYPHMYWWPDAPIPIKRSMLMVNQVKKQVNALDPLAQAKKFFEDQGNAFAFESLPMIYNSFVKREAIEKAKAITGEYFKHNCCDVYSGVVNGAVCKDGMWLEYGVTIRGISGHSNGARFRGEKWKEYTEAAKDQEDQQYSHEYLVPSTNVAIMQASCRMAGTEYFPAQYGKYETDLGQLVNCMFYEVLEEPSKKEQFKQEVTELAEKYKLPVQWEKFDAMEITETIRPVGWQNGYIGVDCETINVKDIYVAASLASAMVG